MPALREEFHEAMRILVGPGPIKQRLIEAYRDHLAALRETDLPDAIRGEFAALKAALHEAHATGGLTAPEASVRKMSERDAAQRATGILTMFAVLAGQAEGEGVPRLRIVGGEDHDIEIDDQTVATQLEIPAFLSRA